MTEPRGGRAGLRIARVADEAMLRDWQHVHNTIIPTDPLSLDQVRERAGRNRLEVAHLGDVLVGCSTVRPPAADRAAGDPATATVIARVLPAHRRRGFGAVLYAQGLAAARAAGAEVIETVVLASNPDGLRFALANGFVEVETYLLPGHEVPYIDLRLA
ncbi:GNAT superfamily N-acetyltransferase [Kitasatospora herbaricolor]|uniref:GNAT family N-acetyltransferase n=1 Tax=Kitasatospora herbaricolor TaxID=68217 RepID=UPI001E2A5BC0|nr:GNAT family N-acetyltransferase [Kitasatospora herbaricolor]MDQ0307576.1 GNAT superfamily N-acetyltransferase [Kitasatospora herbaricolor]